MAEVLDCRGLRCPQPILKAAIKIQTLPPGTTLEIHADCPEFAAQVKEWCEQTGRVLVTIVEYDTYKVATIRS